MFTTLQVYHILAAFQLSCIFSNNSHYSACIVYIAINSHCAALVGLIFLLYNCIIHMYIRVYTHWSASLAHTGRILIIGQGDSSFLPPPKFPMRQPRKNWVLYWPPSEMTKSRTCLPQKWQGPELATPKLTRVAGSGLQSVQRVASSGLRFFWIPTQI